MCNIEYFSIEVDIKFSFILIHQSNLAALMMSKNIVNGCNLYHVFTAKRNLSVADKMC